MYVSLRNNPAEPGGRQRRRGGRTGRVAPLVVTLGVVSLLTDVASESVAAVLPLYVTSVIGLSTIAYGFLDGLHQGASAVVRIAAGWIADRGGQPKWVAFAGYALSAVARGGLLIASGFAALTAIIAVDRIGKGIRTAPRDAMIADAADPDALARSFGVHRMLDNVGAALGPLLAFVILFLMPGGFSMVFLISLAAALFGLAVLGVAVPGGRRSRATVGPGAPQPAASTAPVFRWRQLGDPRLRRLLVAAGLLGLLTIGDGFIYLVLQSRDAFAAEWFPLLYVGTNIAFLALAVPVGRFADRVGRARIFVIGHTALLAAYVVAALPAAGPALTIACLLLLGAFYASTDGILAAIAAHVTPAEARATGIAAAQTVVALTRLVSATGFGLLWFTIGREAAMIMVVIGLAVVIPLVALLLLRGRSAPGIGEGTA